MGKSGFVSKEFLKLFPEIKSKGLKHIVFYHDLLMNDLDISQKLLNECKELGVKIFEDSKVTFFQSQVFYRQNTKNIFLIKSLTVLGPGLNQYQKTFHMIFSLSW